MVWFARTRHTRSWALDCAGLQRRRQSRLQPGQRLLNTQLKTETPPLASSPNRPAGSMGIADFEAYLTSTHGDIDGIDNDGYDAFMDNHIGVMVTNLDNFTDGTPPPPSLPPLPPPPPSLPRPSLSATSISDRPPAALLVPHPAPNTDPAKQPSLRGERRGVLHSLQRWCQGTRFHLKF